MNRTQISNVLFSLSFGVFLFGCTTFDPPDFQYPYTSSMHWFRTANGDMVVLDIIRCDVCDKKTKSFKGLKAMLVSKDGSSLRMLNVEAPSDEWGKFSTQTKPDLFSQKPILGRGENWVAGSVETSKLSNRLNSEITQISFDLSLTPKDKAFSTGRLGTTVVNMNGEDFPKVKTTGQLRINGEEYVIDSYGPTSIHFGDFLPEYITIGNIPQNGKVDTNIPQFLMTSIREDNLKFNGSLLHGKAINYATVGEGSYFPEMAVSAPASKKVFFGKGKYVELLETLAIMPHQFQGKNAVAAVARAQLVESFGQTTDLGLVIVDIRGGDFLTELQIIN